MPRMIIYTPQKIYENRALYWTVHYSNRGLVKAMNIDTEKVIRAIIRNVPAHEIRIDAALYRPLDVIRGQAKAIQDLKWSINPELMCLWYWTEEYWLGFVRLYEALPDPIDAHYLYYERERDGGVLIPVDKYRGNSGTNTPIQVQLQKKSRASRE